jgi:hypothetical protein
MRRRHAEHYLVLAWAAEAEKARSARGDWGARLEREHDNDGRRQAPQVE